MIVRLVTLGCAKNQVDSEQMAALLEDAGHIVLRGAASSRLGSAEAVIVNTCAFIEEAQQEALAVLGRYLERKGAPRGPRWVVAAGCMPQGFAERIQAELPGIDLLAGIADVARIAELLRELAAGNPRPAAEIPLPQTRPADEELPRLIGREAGQAYLRISEGCSNRCSYCVIPDLRGPLRSRPPGLIVEEARQLAAAGVRELTLIGQDSAAYGADREDGTDLAALLPLLAAAAPQAWLRVLYAHPASLLARAERILPALAEHAVPYLDLPLQHADDRILAAMGRRHDSSQALRLIERLREQVPGIVLRSTFIVGLPGETATIFDNLLRFVERAALDVVGAFVYSPMPDTPAAALTCQVPTELAELRLIELLEAAEQAAEPARIMRIGKVVDVLIEGCERDPEYPLIGRSSAQAPEADGVVRLAGGPARRGQIVSALIEGYAGADEFARIGARPV